MPSIPDEEIIRYAQDILVNKPLGTTELATRIAEKLTPNIDARKSLMTYVRRRLNRLLPTTKSFHHVDGKIHQTGRGGLDYERGGKIWRFKEDREYQKRAILQALGFWPEVNVSKKETSSKERQIKGGKPVTQAVVRHTDGKPLGLKKRK